MLLLKDYQRRTLDAVQAWLQALAAERAKADKMAAIDPELAGGYDYVGRAWAKAGGPRPLVPRRTGAGEPLPMACLKVPTGGGKTFLATKVIDLVHTHYRRRQTGLVLWIVPTTQIYQQTIGALKDRDHPYRQALDLASAGRTLILEKTSGFSPADVSEHLCVLMLMLPSANRLTKETLRMFKDSGGYDAFFPREDDPAAHAALLKRTPNLDTFERESGFWGRQIKTSLGNTLRLLNPLVILDEGHKAYSTGARSTLEGFNPSLVLELSATPPEESNVLVEISGQDLLQEGMIKLDLNIYNKRSTDWRDTLHAAFVRRDLLEKQAGDYARQTGHPIRPICLVQVERTGKEQRGAGKIHAEDVREWLVGIKGVPPEWVAVKSSSQDELAAVDDAGGLMREDCPVRFIITKQALQEGWDCSFAYVLAVLTNPGSKTALTQLVGRILRQPYAKKTGVPALDESYVFAFQRRGVDLLDEVRKGFAAEGLGDLRERVGYTVENDSASDKKAELLPPRPALAKAAKRLVLPAFMVREGKKEWRPAHYEADLLARVPWDQVDVSPLADLQLLERKDQDVELRAGLGETALGDDGQAVRHLATPAGELDYAFVAGHVLDALPNPWRGFAIVRKVFETLLAKYPRERVVENYVYIVEELRKQLEIERDRLAEGVFRDLLKRDELRFMVVTEHLSHAEHGIENRLPVKLEKKPGEKKATRTDGSQFELDLFAHVAADDLGRTLEPEVATWLDEQEKLLLFWYRNRAKRDYAVQGWRRGRIFADFIFTAKADGAEEEFDRVFVVETKGLHLKGNKDTDYKRSVFAVCSEHAQRKEWADYVPAMRGMVMKFEVVDEDEWEKRLSGMLAG